MLCYRQREELLYQLKVVQTPPASGQKVDSPWILVDSDGEEVTDRFPIMTVSKCHAWHPYQANSAFHPFGMSKWVVIHVITWITKVATIKQQGCVCLLAVGSRRSGTMSAGPSLWPIGCSPALSVTIGLYQFTFHSFSQCSYVYFPSMTFRKKHALHLTGIEYVLQHNNILCIATAVGASGKWHWH